MTDDTGGKICSFPEFLSQQFPAHGCFLCIFWFTRLNCSNCMGNCIGCLKAHLQEEEKDSKSTLGCFYVRINSSMSLTDLYSTGNETPAAFAYACVLQPTVALCGSRSFILLSPLHDRQGNNVRWNNHIKTSMDIKAVFKATKGKIQEADGVNIGRLP